MTYRGSGEVSSILKFGTVLGMSVRSLYRVGSITARARELVRCKLDLVGV